MRLLHRHLFLLYAGLTLLLLPLMTTWMLAASWSFIVLGIATWFLGTTAWPRAEQVSGRVQITAIGVSVLAAGPEPGVGLLVFAGAGICAHLALFMCSRVGEIAREVQRVKTASILKGLHASTLVTTFTVPFSIVLAPLWQAGLFIAATAYAVYHVVRTRTASRLAEALDRELARDAA